MCVCVAFYIFWQKVILLAGAWFLWCTVFHSPVTRTGSDKFLAMGERTKPCRPFPQNRQQSFLPKTQGGKVSFSIFSEPEPKRVALAYVVLLRSCYFVSHVLSCRKHVCYIVAFEAPELMLCFGIVMCAGCTQDPYFLDPWKARGHLVQIFATNKRNGSFFSQARASVLRA